MIKLFDNSLELYTLAKRFISGGVNSPVRAFHGVGGTPIFLKKAKGAYLFDQDHRQYIDYIGSWGPMILGHCHPNVVAAIQEAATLGLSFGAPNVLEVKMAEKLCALMPSLEQVRLVNSGTEATMSAIRLARAYTKRSKIIKFAGCYHGHSDSLLVNAGSGALTLGVPSSPGVTQDTAKDTLTATYNDLASVAQLFTLHPDAIAAVIVEPVAANMNCVLPLPDFLPGLRELCTKHQSLLIFDEVITGFRVGLGGAQEYYKVYPDLTTLGKIIGGGLPVGAYGGRQEIMAMISPSGPVYQAGTLSGNPVVMAAGLATLDEVCKPLFYKKLSERCTYLAEGLRQAALKANVSCVVHNMGGLFGIFFTTDKQIHFYDQVVNCNVDFFKQFFHLLLAKGVYLAPSAFEAGFISAAHTMDDVNNTISAAAEAFTQLIARPADFCEGSSDEIGVVA